MVFKKSAKLGCGIAGFLILLFVVWACFAAWQDRVPEPIYLLHSTEPFHAIRVPFTLSRNGGIFVPAELSGKIVKCQVDTGSPDLFWDNTLYISGKMTGRLSLGTDVAGKETPPCPQIVLPTVRLGNYEVRDLPTYAMDTTPPKGEKENPNQFAFLVHQTPMAGNSTFAGVVLTIDYHQKTLILRDRSYNFYDRKLASNAVVLPFALLHSNPTVKCSVNGVPARMIFDTGWHNYAGLDAKFSQKAYPGVKPEKALGLLFYPRAHIAFGTHRLPVPFSTSRDGNGNFIAEPVAMATMAYPNVKHGEDVILGYPFLRFFRITFDYPRQKILLEPYDQSVVQILPKGSLLSWKRPDQKLLRRRFDSDMVIFHYADKTTTVTLL